MKLLRPVESKQLKERAENNDEVLLLKSDEKLTAANGLRLRHTGIRCIVSEKETVYIFVVFFFTLWCCCLVRDRCIHVPSTITSVCSKDYLKMVLKIQIYPRLKLYAMRKSSMAINPRLSEPCRPTDQRWIVVRQNDSDIKDFLSSE